MNQYRFLRLPPLLCAVALTALLAACTTPPPPPPPVVAPPAPVVALPPPLPAGPPSNAGSLLEYRLDAAYHLYDLNRDRIYHGVLPHFLYAIGVLEMQVDSRGNLIGLNWMRAPDHAPEVIAEIERTVRQAAPFPAPVRMGHATYIETWLWDASGNFQLHTLSEGQGSKGSERRKIPADPRAIRIVAAPATEQ